MPREWAVLGLHQMRLWFCYQLQQYEFHEVCATADHRKRDGRDMHSSLHAYSIFSFYRQRASEAQSSSSSRSPSAFCLQACMQDISLHRQRSRLNTQFTSKGAESYN